jgi:hypothetical protein
MELLVDLDDLTFTHLRYLVAMLNGGTMTAAAARAEVSVPTLSRELRNIEKILDVPLIRTARTCQLTPSGIFAAERAAKLLEARGELVDETLAFHRQWLERERERKERERAQARAWQALQSVPIASAITGSLSGMRILVEDVLIEIDAFKAVAEAFGLRTEPRWNRPRDEGFLRPFQALAEGRANLYLEWRLSEAPDFRKGQPLEFYIGPDAFEWILVTDSDPLAGKKRLDPDSLRRRECHALAMRYDEQIRVLMRESLSHSQLRDLASTFAERPHQQCAIVAGSVARNAPAAYRPIKVKTLHTSGHLFLHIREGLSTAERSEAAALAAALRRTLIGVETPSAPELAAA